MTTNAERPPLKWSTQLDVLSSESTPPLRGDKIVLPASSLEALLAAATVIVSSTSQPQTSNFDPYNPYSFAAERQAREHLIERQQQLPHPLTFRLVNPVNGRIVFAGIREFSARDGKVGLSAFLRESLGIGGENGTNGSTTEGQNGTLNGIDTEIFESTEPRLTVHVQELPKGTYVKLRPLEAGYDAEDWKALLEQYLRDHYTTLTNGEVLAIPAGRETFRFLVDGLKPNDQAITLVDTDLEVDIEPLNEEQARETLQRLVQKSKKAPGTSEGSSSGGKIRIDTSEPGQVRPGEYVDYNIGVWDKASDLDFELSALDSEKDLDMFITPYGPKHRGRPREDDYVFGDISTKATKRIKVRQTNTGLENAEALWVSVRGYEHQGDGAQGQTPIQYILQVSATNDSSSSVDVSMSLSDNEVLGADEERCTNCHQSVPKRTMFLHQNFCLRNNILCPHCQNVFQKSSSEWKSHWHCPHDSAYGNTPSSHNKHNTLMHTPQSCSSCDYQAANIPDLAYHRTTTCPGKLILCQFCHLQVPQQGPEDPLPSSPEVIMSGLTPHELSDGARTTECHICAKIVRLRDMPTHLKYHDHQRLSRQKPRICRNINCGRTLDGIGKGGEVRVQGARNDLGVCDVCFGPLYVSMYDPDGKALRRRVERKYLTQLLSGCGQSWCRNEFCKNGRRILGLTGEDQVITSKEALAMIKPSLESLKNMTAPVFLCTDEASQRRRTLAEMMAAEGGVGDTKGKGKGKERAEMGAEYDLEWCIAALETVGGDLDKGRQWLKDYAPTRHEAAR
ncbi:ubiquitin fusion degradation protein 1, partial [Lecanoromycetidae sp. Uapishka_2]